MGLELVRLDSNCVFTWMREAGGIQKVTQDRTRLDFGASGFVRTRK